MKKILFLFILCFSLFNVCEVNAFERSIVNSTGFATYNMPLKKSASDSSSTLSTVTSGEPFLINYESGNFWNVTYNGKTGFVRHDYCMINLPDVIPSIVYNITNASGSIYKSSGYSLPGVTGNKLYSAGKVYNKRIGRYEYIVPVLYSTAKKISLAQNKALKDGYSLKIYDAYRPYSVSVKVKNSLNTLYNSNSIVRNNINYSYGLSGRRYKWSKGWFISSGVSTHNTGSAIDVSLVNNNTKKELNMPTNMHELSVKAIKYYSSGVSMIPKNYSKEMTWASKKLDSYFMNTGMTPLASEWWHFKDSSGDNRINNINSKLHNGSGYGCDFQVTSIVSK